MVSIKYEKRMTSHFNKKKKKKIKSKYQNQVGIQEFILKFSKLKKKKLFTQKRD